MNSQQALELSSRDFSGARSLVYKGTLNESNDELRFAPADQSLQLQKAEIYVPPQLEADSRLLAPPDFSMALTVLRYELETVLDKRFPKRPGFAQVVDKASVPLIVDSMYLAKGEPLREKSMYELMYIAVISDQPYKRPTVTFKGISFLQRLPIGQEPSELLKSLWDQAPPS
ncbi:MAG TPA: hypothetical protein VGS22_12210 [Thermoanaerobaculia bacterium]|nr:hypothetical protein [Thermoanaerobaculia bacterium]